MTEQPQTERRWEPSWRTIDADGVEVGPWRSVSELPPKWHSWDHCACLVPRKDSVRIEWFDPSIHLGRLLDRQVRS
jgi:hypothetical protein